MNNFLRNDLSEEKWIKARKYSHSNSETHSKISLWAHQEDGEMNLKDMEAKEFQPFLTAISQHLAEDLAQLCALRANKAMRWFYIAEYALCALGHVASYEMLPNQTQICRQ